MAATLKALIFALALAVATAELSRTVSKLHGKRRTHRSGELIFEDNFDTLDFDNWQHEITMAGGGNWEFQVYWNNRTNSYVRDSTLFLKPTLTSDRFGEEFINTGHLDLWGGGPGDYCTMNSFYGCERVGAGNNIINPIASARLRTVDTFSFLYGKVEVRAKQPAGDWIWPAIWMLPAGVEYGQWPTSGEIDIMESRGNLQYTLDGENIGAEQYGVTLHYGIDYVTNGWEYAHFSRNTAAGQGWDKEFHRFQCEWAPDYVKFSVDDEELGTVQIPEGGMFELGQFETSHPGVANPWEGQAKNAPFDKMFYIVLNVAVGGTGYFPDEAVNVGGKPWSNQSPNAAFDFWSAKASWLPTWNLDQNNGEDAAMQVDYVRVWAL
jgi:hypothetical protein